MDERQTGIGRIQGHWFKSLMLAEGRAGPFPDSTHISLPCKLITFGSDGDGMPILKSHIGTFKVDEKLLKASINLGGL